jgi:hypothetical protein
MKACWGGGGIAPRNLTSPLDEGKWSASRPGCFTLKEMDRSLDSPFMITSHLV